MPEIAAMLPEAHFIHVIRDPRDTALSWRKTWFAPSQDFAIAGPRVAPSRRPRPPLGRDAAAVHRDALRRPGAAAARPELRRLCDFLALDWSPAMLDTAAQGAARLARIQGRTHVSGRVISREDRTSIHVNLCQAAAARAHRRVASRNVGGGCAPRSSGGPRRCWPSWVTLRSTDPDPRSTTHDPTTRHAGALACLIPLSTWLLFCAACVALALTPGPNMLLLVSRTLVQGRRAGLLTLAGTQSGLAVHIAAVALGLAALLAAVPLAYDTIARRRLYLAWIAWQTWRRARPGCERREPRVPAARLYRDGVLSSILNPKIALFELALFPQFIDPSRGSVLAQTLILGVTQFVIVFPFDAGSVLAAAACAGCSSGTGAGRTGHGARSPAYSQHSRCALRSTCANDGANEAHGETRCC